MREGVAADKRAGGSDDRHASIIHPTEFHVRLDVLVELLVRQESGLEALVLALQILVVVEIEYRTRARSYLRPGEELVAHDGVARAGARRDAPRGEAIGDRAAKTLNA